MGIFNRDYLQDERPSWGGGGGGGKGFFASMPPAVRWILVANIVVIVLQLFWLERNAFGAQISIPEEWLALSGERVFSGEVWRLVTNAFCHDRHGFFHFLINMMLLVWFGGALERMYGTREFACFYFAAVLFASAIYLTVDFFTEGSSRAIGASGAVLAIMMVYAMHYPRERILLFFVIPVEIRWLVLIVVIGDAVMGLVTPIAKSAHLGGLAFGFAYKRFGWRLSGLLFEKTSGSSRRRAKPSRGTRARGPSGSSGDGNSGRTRTAKQDAEVDRILRKVSEEGLPSLTPQERQTLQQASEDYRER
ncbi:MAG: rhomboid family intramembrane serine protease [Planctomycetota bacterium]